MLKLLLAVLVFVAVPFCNAVTSGTSGMATMHQCGLSVKSQDGGTLTPMETALSIQCAAMAEGVMDTLVIWGTTAKAHGTTLQGTACFPVEMTVGQAVRVAFKYMQGHPELLHLEGAALMYLALTDSFPCPVV